MITSIFVAVAQNVVLGWLWRRLQELVAFIAGLAPIIATMPPEHQAFVMDILQGRGGALSISAYIGFGLYLWTQWQSYRATVKPQVVTTEGRKVTLGKGTPEASRADAVAATAPRPRTLWERLTGQ
jgi:hypothetical protein